MPFECSPWQKSPLQSDISTMEKSNLELWQFCVTLYLVHGQTWSRSREVAPATQGDGMLVLRCGLILFLVDENGRKLLPCKLFRTRSLDLAQHLESFIIPIFISKFCSLYLGIGACSGESLRASWICPQSCSKSFTFCASGPARVINLAASPTPSVHYVADASVRPSTRPTNDAR